ncbi:hypothetical protein [Paraburkholderia diazotrophica]|nr:hypothetical protein [Paraburkholderia diazotrophica]
MNPRQSLRREFPPTAFAMIMATGIVSIVDHGAARVDPVNGNGS